MLWLMEKREERSQLRAGGTTWGVFASSLFVMFMAFVVVSRGELGWLIVIGWMMLGVAAVTAVVFYGTFRFALGVLPRISALWRSSLVVGIIVPAVFNLLSLPDYLDGKVLTLGLLASIFGVWIPLVVVAAIVTVEERSQQQPGEPEQQPT